MNKVILTGNIASDVELKTTPQGVSVTSFSLAVKRPRTKNDVTDFITIVCWRSTAEFVSKYFRKGSGIEVSGILTQRKWQDKDGNNRYATEVIADEVDFGKKSKADASATDNAASAAYAHQESGDFSEVADDDLPF